MTDFDAFRHNARAWLQSVAPIYGKEARQGLSEEEDVALARRYLAARFDAGFAGINWPADVGGQGLSAVEKVIFETEEQAVGAPYVYFGVSLGMPIPILIKYGAPREWVKERVVKALRGEEMWCQLFSEPAAGSDLAGIRMRAEPVEGGWILNGQKTWTSQAQHCDYGVIIARTDPAAPKHRGLTYYWVDMKAAGVTVSPIRLAGGDSHVNEVFFDDLFVADSQRLSPVNGGFSVAIETLMIERYVASDSAGAGPSLDSFIALAERTTVAGRPAIEDGRIRSAIARHYAMRRALETITARAMLMMQAGMEPGPEGSLNKLVAVRSRQRLSELAVDLQGAAGFDWIDRDPTKQSWQNSWITAATGRIAGGADEMLLNTIAERILGLPQDHRPDKGLPFNEIPA
ncbi:MAG TPA: acyl-CoA dehydrogenase family protein [Sphingobium sp.]